MERAKLMSPETDANDHVPLEFLLGARVKYYVPDSSNASIFRRSIKAKRILAPSTHPRQREEQARHLLRRVLEHEGPRPNDGPLEPANEDTKPDKSAVLRALAEAVSTAALDEESIADPDGFQLSFDDDRRSPVQIKTLQQMQDDDVKRQQRRDNSFHGYEQNQRSFLDVSGAAARIPHTTTQQLRDLKLNVVNAKKKLEDERKQELLEMLQEQQAFTRTALHQHQLSKRMHQQKHPRTVSTKVLALDNIENLRGEADARQAARTLIPLQVHYEQKLLEEHSQRPIMTTLNFDARMLSLSPTKDKKTDVMDYDGVLSTSNNDDSQDSSDADDDSEQVRRRLGNRQREVFASTAASGLFLGGGFISKKTTEKKSLSTHSTTIPAGASFKLQASANSWKPCLVRTPPRFFR